MINWIFVVSVTLGAALGAELGRRRAIFANQPVSLMPVFHERAFSFFGCLGAALSCELGRVALAAPTRENVLYLICAGLFAAGVLGAHLSRELFLTRKALARHEQE